MGRINLDLKRNRYYFIKDFQTDVIQAIADAQEYVTSIGMNFIYLTLITEEYLSYLKGVYTFLGKGISLSVITSENYARAMLNGTVGFDDLAYVNWGTAVPGFIKIPSAEAELPRDLIPLCSTSTHPMLIDKKNGEFYTKRKDNTLQKIKSYKIENSPEDVIVIQVPRDALDVPEFFAASVLDKQLTKMWIDFIEENETDEGVATDEIGLGFNGASQDVRSTIDFLQGAIDASEAIPHGDVLPYHWVDLGFLDEKTQSLAECTVAMPNFDYSKYTLQGYYDAFNEQNIEEQQVTHRETAKQNDFEETDIFKVIEIKK